MSNAGMSGFVSFLEHPAEAEAPEGKIQEGNGVAGKSEPPVAIPEQIAERPGKIRPAVAVERWRAAIERGSEGAR